MGNENQNQNGQENEQKNGHGQTPVQKAEEKRIDDKRKVDQKAEDKRIADADKKATKERTAMLATRFCRRILANGIYTANCNGKTLRICGREVYSPKNVEEAKFLFDDPEIVIFKEK